MLQRCNANLNDTESLKEILDKHNYGKVRKWNIVRAYILFLKMQGLTRDKPKYYPVEKIPAIPTEQQIDSLITGSSRQEKPEQDEAKHTDLNGTT